MPLLSSKKGASPELTADTLSIARALALLWTFRPRTTIYQLLRPLGYKREDGRAFTNEDVKQQLEELKARGLLVGQPQRDGFYRLKDEFRAALYRQLLDDTPAEDLRAALYDLDSLRMERGMAYWPVYDRSATIGILRIALFSGTPAAELNRMVEAISRSLPGNEIISEAVLAAFDGELLLRIDPAWRWELCYSAISAIPYGWQAQFMPVADWVLSRLATDLQSMPVHLRLILADLLIAQGEAARAQQALHGIDDGVADALRATLLAHEGRWAEAQNALEAALKRRQGEIAARKRVFPESIAWYYPLVLLAQQTPKHLELARKFCLGEAGKRAPAPDFGWGRWVHAIGSRLGEVALNRGVFEPHIRWDQRVDLDDLWRLLLAAWLGPQAVLGKGKNKDLLTDYTAALRQRLRACRLAWLEAQLDAAVAVLQGAEPPAPFFVAGQSEAWRDVLLALQALGTEGGGRSGDRDDGANTRIVWSLRIGRHGALEEVDAFEQKRGVRGWSKPKALSLAKLVGNEKLSPWDAKVARAIRADRAYARRYELDRATAVMALIGHPNVVLAEAPEVSVELVEGQPEIEALQDGNRFILRVTPPLRRDADQEERYYLSAEALREQEALRAITLVQDSPQRLRVIRLTAAQRRAAQLLAERVAVPASAQEELQKTLRALAGHFQVQADHAQAAREVASESRLRAELSPSGENLLLRLVVAPLGPDGPRLPPAAGRARLMAAIGGETVGTRRALDLEQRHLEAVLDALPFLAEPEPGGACEWLVEEPEAALGMVETLPSLAAVTAIDWPKGKQVRVLTVDSAQLGVKVSSGRDWFHVSGQARLDEGRVLELAALLAAAQSRSRFVPIGDGVYAALTRNLKERLADLAALAELDRKGARLPRLAAAWLDDALAGVATESDEEFRTAIERLREAQDLVPPLPGTLQAELRPYQEDGYRWAMRLAGAGLGACLADDMGLGKTLQALAVLLARAADGPALILAPTSVCGNWLAEAQRFAPSLNMQIYGEGGNDRARQLAGVGPMDALIVSYTLFQQAQEKFTGQHWHTVIADEAQAIKNASAKRSLAVFELAADFRLALSGTPVENRLAELWSIMRFANPGLLGTLSRFNERYATPIERNRDREAQHFLRRLIAPFVMRRTKAQVLAELPPRTEQLIAVAPDANETAHYEALRRLAVAEASRSVAEAPGQAKLNILAQLTRLRRAACDPRLTTPEFAAAGAKVQAFAELAAELTANGHKALVFSQFVDFLTLLRAPLEAAGIRYQYLDGATPAAERTRRVAAFQAGEGDLFLISLKAGGFGLNLTAADYVVITDPWWNPAAEDQAMGRAHRLGQQRPVTVYRMVTQGTVEERIVDLHQDKRALAESVLAEGDASALPTTEDLLALIRGE